MLYLQTPKHNPQVQCGLQSRASGRSVQLAGHPGEKKNTVVSLKAFRNYLKIICAEKKKVKFMNRLPLLISQIVRWLVGHSVWPFLHLVFVAFPLAELPSYPEFSSRKQQGRWAGLSCSQTETKAIASKIRAASRPVAHCHTEESEAPS